MTSVAIIGFGEAGQAFAEGAEWRAAARVFDIATLAAPSTAAKRADYAHAGVQGCDSLADALSTADIVLCLVTADQALAAARAAAPLLPPGALWCDMNSVAPATKRAAAAAVTAAGGRYLDVAVMAPVLPARRAVPLCLAGPDVAAGGAALAALGFSNRRCLAGEVGAAAAVKMLRSVIIKGIEALTAEAFVGARRAGVVDDLLAALGDDWRPRSDYNLDRMMVHGARRAAEMDEVVATLAALGLDPAMSRATANWQRALARGAAPAGLTAKLEQLA